MTNLQQKAEEIIKNREIFVRSTDHHVKEFRDNHQRFDFYRTDEITALDILYGKLVVNETQYKSSLAADQNKKVLDEKLSLQRLVQWQPSVEQLEQRLSYQRLTPIFTEEKTKLHHDYLLRETAFAIVLDLDKIIGSAIEQFRMNTSKAHEMVKEIFEAPHNYAKVDCLVWCYEQMAARIKQAQGWG